MNHDLKKILINMTILKGKWALSPACAIPTQMIMVTTSVSWLNFICD